MYIAFVTSIFPLKDTKQANSRTSENELYVFTACAGLHRVIFARYYYDDIMMCENETTMSKYKVSWRQIYNFDIQFYVNKFSYSNIFNSIQPRSLVIDVG